MPSNGITNGVSNRQFKAGVWCPLVTPFKSGSEELDTDALSAQVIRLAAANVGIVLLGELLAANSTSFADNDL